MLTPQILFHENCWVLLLSVFPQHFFFGNSLQTLTTKMPILAFQMATWIPFAPPAQSGWGCWFIYPTKVSSWSPHSLLQYTCSLLLSPCSLQWRAVTTCSEEVCTCGTEAWVSCQVPGLQNTEYGWQLWCEVPNPPGRTGSNSPAIQQVCRFLMQRIRIWARNRKSQGVPPF